METIGDVPDKGSSDADSDKTQEVDGGSEGKRQHFLLSLLFRSAIVCILFPLSKC